MLKYKISFADRLNKVWRIEIDSPNFTGEPIVLTPSDNPLIIDYQGNDDDDIFKMHFIPSSATINVVSTGVDIDELMYINDASFKCRVYDDLGLYWQGCLVSDGIQEIDSGVPYDLTIRAIDGLEVLDNIPLSWDNYGSVTVNGAPSELRAPINAFRVSLYGSSNLDNKLPIKWNSPLKNDQYPTSDMIAGKTTIAPRGEMLDRNNSCLWWLSNLSKSAQSWIYQSRGFWYINNYFRSLTGNFGGNQIDSASTGSIIATANNEVSVTNILPSDTVNENWFWFGKKPYRSVSVVYNDTKIEDGNLIPNGNFDKWSLGQPLYWRAEAVNVPTGYLSMHESLYQREGYAIEVVNTGQDTEDMLVTFEATIPVDSDILYKKMLMGFTIMPIAGYNTDSNGVINFSNKPIKMSLRYQLEGTPKSFYLNEFGYWQSEARGTNLGVYYVGNEMTGEALNSRTYESYYEGSPNIGDVLVLGIRPKSGSNHQEFSFTVTSLEQGNLELALIKLMDNIPNSINGWNISNKRVSMQSPTRGSIRTSYFVYLGSPSGRTYKSNAIEEFRFIYPEISSMKLRDVASVVFQGKGGNNEILMPQGLGFLKIMFYAKRNQRFVLDDVYVNVGNAHDIYKVTEYNSKNSNASYEMDISSGYSGNIESSYGDGYATRNRSMNWDGGGTLTEHYAKAIMSVRNKPIRVFSGSIDKIIPYGLFTLMGRTYAPLSLRVNVRDNISDVVGAEFNPSIGVWDVEHKSTN